MNNVVADEIELYNARSTDKVGLMLSLVQLKVVQTKSKGPRRYFVIEIIANIKSYRTKEIY